MPEISFSVPDGFSVTMVKGLPRLKISVPGLLAALGVRRWMRERALHAPQTIVDQVAPTLQMVAEAIGRTKGRPTPNADDYWRAFEETQVDMLYDGVLVKIHP